MKRSAVWTDAAVARVASATFVQPSAHHNVDTPETPDLAERLIASVLSVRQGGTVLETPTLLAKVIVRDSA
jgi:hypothetical protein